MTRQQRIRTAIAACVIHLALLVPTVGSSSWVLENDFALEAEAIADGERPYGQQRLEYPPLSIPLLAGPALFTDGIETYSEAFEWEMIGFDLAIVVLLALCVAGSGRRVWGAIGVYTLGVVLLSDILVDAAAVDSAPLALARFDLAPALFVLAAIFARERSRSALWGAMLSLGVAIKAYPLLVLPVLARGERRPWRVAVAAAIPVAVAAAIVIAWGDDFSSAIDHHRGRDLHVESIAATPFVVADLLGSELSSVPTGGSHNLVVDGAAAARTITTVLMVAVYALVLAAGWRRADHLRLSTALLTAAVVLAPLLSPQFLFWLLPLSAAAFGIGRENAVLLLAFLFTQLAFQHYDGAIGELSSEFDWRIAVRNLLLLAYLALVCVPLVREGWRGVALGRWGPASST